ncbi:TonB-dependent receptor [Fulvivirgaceae bacterium BMA12]|uniref:TonB-dependent receptor n=1 Tax=Agaribacillus aureus TaxID=3051825 RepID=A0ABT8LEQ7_9BACT|nr:TonB-dependent receptor [Fulvivirgaceae bacterium BMA12]
MKKILLSLTCGMLLILWGSSTAHAQTGTVEGTVLDGDNQEALIGATVVLKGTTKGATTDINGRFTLSALDAGRQTIVISYVGYQNREMFVDVIGGQTVDLGNVTISVGAVGLKEVEIIASVAIDRKTPVAVSTIKGSEIEAKIGNQEFPEILRSTPSIYATKQGGGFGDSRINVRGFDQRNTAVLINGVPVNDMENGWVFWSNWAGLSDVTSNIQVQRGLSASKLAIASVGGTINIITNAAEMKKGSKVGYTVGNDGYNKFAISTSTGLTENGWAISLQATHTRGDGYIDGTEFRAYSYFASVAKIFNDRHSIHLTALGAPQWHNQREIGQFDGITLETFDERGLKYNHLWGTLDGEEFSWRRNFYHKPKVFINHYWNISQKTELATTAYISYGRGGGTGPRGQLNGSFDNSSKFKDENGQIRFEDIRRWNQGQNVPDFGDPRVTWGELNPGVDNRQGFFADKFVNTSGEGFVRRASVNSHNWVGVISNLTHELSDRFNLTAGIDLRHYRGIHYRRIDNLLGADAYFTNTNINLAGQFITEEKEAKAIADLKDDAKLNYHNDGVVQWIGFFGQLEYNEGPLSAFVSSSLSNQGFKRIDYFNYLDGDDTEADGNPKQETDFENFLGGNIKGGINYNLDERHNVFANAGFYSKQPIFDNVYLNFLNEVNPDVENERVLGFELGYGYRSKMFSANLNLYRTAWTNRFLSRDVEIENQDGRANLAGIDQIHTGVEVDMTFRPISKLTIDGMLSVGDWTYGDNISAAVFNDARENIGTFTFYLDGVKVGDAAQTTARIGATYEIIKGLRLFGSWYYAGNLYADYDVTTDEVFETPGNQAVEIPSYNLVDAGLYYDFKIGKLDVTWRLNVNNVFDEEYISELDTNEVGEDKFKDNRGFYGFGTTWNSGIRVSF